MASVKTMYEQFELTGLPNQCPFCHTKIKPIIIFAHKRHFDTLEVLLACPNEVCERSFIGYYAHAGNHYYSFQGYTSIGRPVEFEFSETIKSISENFITIYNQSYFAEQHGLSEICGVGYRKAIEFLIKDYITINLPDDKIQIQKKFLGDCIKDYINDERIKSVAKRAVWLGNDETHYVRKWDEKNLNDLKTLIELTVHWIEMESLTKKMVEEMPD